MIEEIARSSRFAIASHQNPDGDSIGAQLAMRRILAALGKSVAVISVDPVPQQYRFLTDWREIRQQSSIFPEVDCLIVLDSSSFSRTGLPPWSKALINIDHHSDNAMFGTANWTSAEASCCCQLVFTLADCLGVAIDPVMAECLFVGLLTDTGGFRFSNTRAEIFEMSAKLVRQGLDVYAVNRCIYNNNTLAKVRLRGKILSAAKILFDGRVGFIEMEAALTAEYGAQPEDTEGISDEMMRVAGVEIAVFARYSGNQTKFNLRSTGAANVGAIARRFGGGGHAGAAGCTLSVSGEEARGLLMEAIEETLGALPKKAETCLDPSANRAGAQ